MDIRCLLSAVLILVLMEDTLGVPKEVNPYVDEIVSLNPCFNGRYSRSLKGSTGWSCPTES